MPVETTQFKKMNALKNATILAIDDEPLNLMLLEDFLQHRCQQLLVETDIESALVLAREKQPDVILLDIVMADIDGYQVCQRLKSAIETAAIPVIFLSSLISAEDKVKGFEVGGVDYISKPFDIAEMLARLENCLKLHQQINQTQKTKAQQRKEKIALYQLNEREIEILGLYVSGYTRDQIAKKIYLSENTVKWYLKQLFVKLDIKNRTQAIEKANEIGLINS